MLVLVVLVVLVVQRQLEMVLQPMTLLRLVLWLLVDIGQKVQLGSIGASDLKMTMKLT